MRQKTKRGILSVAGAIIAPLLIYSAYLFFSRWPHRSFTTWADYGFLSISIASGLASLCLLPIRPPVRIPILILYAITATYTMFFYGFIFIGWVFNDWL